MDDCHPAVLPAISYLAAPGLGLQHFADQLGISRQAFHKQVQNISKYLTSYGQPPAIDPELGRLRSEVERLSGLVAKLRRQLIIAGAFIFLLKCFKDRVIKFFPKYDVKRFKPWEKKHLLDLAQRFIRAGGSLKDFCKAIGKSHATFADWQKKYEKYGMAGLADKTTRPKHFTNRIPMWVRNLLLDLFLRFPQWKPWQYYKYMAHNPAIQWHVSLPVIVKMKNTQRVLHDEEIARIKKRWCFEPGTVVWTVDFTTILKTGSYHLRLLTVSDHRSRYFFETALFLQANTENVVSHLEDLFIKYGKPSFIKADNGPEFRTECRSQLEKFSVDLFNSPEYYGQFNGAHERLHRTLKGNITKFSTHHDIFKLVREIDQARDDLNCHYRLDCLGGKTPNEIFFGDDDFIPTDVEVVKPYIKDGELRMKFTDRNGNKARMSTPHCGDKESTT